MKDKREIIRARKAFRRSLKDEKKFLKQGKKEVKKQKKDSAVLDEKACWMMTDLLQDAVLHGTGGGAYIGRPMAGKTGTTDDEHDAWFVGYTPDMITAVWIGDDTSSNAGYTGGTIPASIWKDFMSEALRNTQAHSFSVPKSVQEEIERTVPRKR